MTSKDLPIVHEMLTAVNANIEYLRSEGSNRISVSNGKLRSKQNDTYIYGFEYDFLSELEDSAEFIILAEGKRIHGKLISYDDRCVVIELEQYIGDSIASAQIIYTNSVLMEILSKKLTEQVEGDIVPTDYCNYLFNLDKYNVSQDVSYNIPQTEFPPNSYQEKAIRLSLGSDVTFVWGPPGSGKTKTISQIVEGFLHKNKSVLLISHTNIATDGALLSVVKHLEDTIDYKEGKLIRYGRIQKVELKDYYYANIENVVELYSEDLKKDKDKALERKSLLSKELAAIQKVKNEFSKFHAVKKKHEQAHAEILRYQERVDNSDVKIRKLQALLDEIDYDIRKCEKSNFLVRKFKGLDKDRLLHHKAKALADMELEGEKKRKSEKNLAITKRKAKSYIAKIEQFEWLERAEVPSSEDIEELERQIKNVTKEIKELEEKLSEVEGIILKKAKVVATTLTKSYCSKEILARSYDCIILDEASMAPLPAVWLAAGLACKRIVIVGDFLQLPPVVKHRPKKPKEKDQKVFDTENRLVEKWLKKDIFFMSEIVKHVGCDTPPKNLVQLSYQYRMHPDICYIINKLVYSNWGTSSELISGENTYDLGKERLHKLPLPDHHVGVYDTSEDNPVSCRSGSGSRYCIYNSFLTVHLAKQALESGYESIGIISPFRAQINLTKKVLKDLGIDNVDADTVHRFQGGEKQVIIFDLCVPFSTLLTDDKEEGGDDEKLINVAFSRAKEKCILVADVNKVLKNHSDSSLILKFIQICKTKGHPFIPTKGLMPGFDASHEEYLRKIYNKGHLDDEFSGSNIHDENDFYKVFVDDLLKVKNEVIIESPFISMNRVSLLLPFFTLIRERGVNVFILTRHPEQHKDQMADDAMKAFKIFDDLGIYVLPFNKKIHEKLIVIDRAITYEGSLNVLSQRSSNEIMRRIEGKETAKQILDFLNIDRNIGAMGSPTIKPCPTCTEPGAWFWTEKTNFGYWREYCLYGNHKHGEKAKSKKEKDEENKKWDKYKKQKKQYVNGVPICPLCEKKMKLKDNRWGSKFWGCPNYPKCKVTEKYQEARQGDLA